MLRSLILAATLSLPMLASAQQPASPAQQGAAQADVDPNTLVRNALQVAQAVDQNQIAQLYDAASATAKRTVTRDAFISTVSTARRPLGAPVSRTWWSVTRQVIPADGQAPAGNYISVRFVTSFNGGSTAAELISFRLDEDGVLRLAGYVLQP